MAAKLRHNVGNEVLFLMPDFNNFKKILGIPNFQFSILTASLSLWLQPEQWIPLS